MRFKSVSIIILIYMSLVVLTGCNDAGHNAVRFNKAQWDSIGDLRSHPNRADMLEDLIKHHKIKGLTYHQIVDSLGQPENYGDTKDSIRYDIIVEYGYLDPKSGKYLSIGFDKDSMATGFNIVEWKNRHANE